MSTTAPEPRLLPVGVGFAAGFVDTLGFVALFSFFTAHVTGSFVVLGSELSEGFLSLLVPIALMVALAIRTRVQAHP